MKPVKDNYPVFEANQVLTNIHLNDIFNYLDEQERLTRANLIGIGIVCGLEIRHETTEDSVTVVHITKGCGITSEGYLIVEPKDLTLVSYRPYTLPADLEYPPFKLEDEGPSLWEMFPEGESVTTPLNKSFLDDKVIVLFLELKKEDLRNCSPNNCDDKGAQVTATVRRLLIEKEALNKIIAKANQLGVNLTFTDLESTMMARLNLPDLRLPRLGVPNRGLATSNDVFAAFQSVFQTEKLAAQMKKALGTAYVAFRPLLKTLYPEDPFSDFAAKFGFLDTTLQKGMEKQVLFLQYYYDFFDDLIKAYDEFRWKGVELMCVCCPPEGLFPRHLMLGELYPETATSPGVYRHSFLASSGIGGCDERIKDLKLLFQRLVEMVVRFTHTPPLPPDNFNMDLQIRITPSQLGDVPLGNKAIPYYYQQNGDPSLYHLWNAEKSRRNRVNQNLSYRADEYRDPAAPPFITDALRYDLEPYNFLRIEGHLGKNYLSVLDKLISLKTQYRLPIEIIALRTGVFDETIPVNLDKEKCHFQDLEALYDTLREELLSSLTEGMQYLYSNPLHNFTGPAKITGGKPNHPLLQAYAPNYIFPENSVGAWYERYLDRFKVMSYIDVDQNNVDPAMPMVYCTLFNGTVDLPAENYAHIVSIYYLSKLHEILPTELNLLIYADFENKYQDLLSLVRFFRSDAVSKISRDLQAFIPQEDLIDHFDQILFSCKLQPIKSVHEEYVQRLREIKQKQFLSFFLQSNPGIQHKAGVPLGGTFIIVYHEDPEAVFVTTTGNLSVAPSMPTTNVIVNRLANSQDFSNTVSQINNIDPALWSNNVVFNSAEFGNLDIYALFRQWLIEKEINLSIGSEASQIINQTVTDGTVIADFFLPYLCCSDCSPVQYVLPTPPLSVDVRIGCTYDRDNIHQADITITPGEGTAPFTYQLDGEESEELPAEGITITLRPDNYTLIVRDAAGRESVRRMLSIPLPLSIKNASDDGYLTQDDPKVTGQKPPRFRLVCKISGGNPPYSTKDNARIEGDTYYHGDNKYEVALPYNGVTFVVSVTDKSGCDKVVTIRVASLG